MSARAGTLDSPDGLGQGCRPGEATLCVSWAWRWGLRARSELPSRRYRRPRAVWSHRRPWESGSLGGRVRTAGSPSGTRVLFPFAASKELDGGALAPGHPCRHGALLGVHGGSLPEPVASRGIGSWWPAMLGLARVVLLSLREGRCGFKDAFLCQRFQRVEISYQHCSSAGGSPCVPSGDVSSHLPCPRHEPVCPSCI